MLLALYKQLAYQLQIALIYPPKHISEGPPTGNIIWSASQPRVLENIAKPGSSDAVLCNHPPPHGPGLARTLGAVGSSLQHWKSKPSRLPGGPR